MAASQITSNVVIQLNELGGGMPNKLDFCMGDWLQGLRVRPGVADVPSLPALDNVLGDVRYVDSLLTFRTWNGAAWIALAGGGVTAHSALTGLTAPADDHTQYPLQTGRATGQTIIGGLASGEELTLRGTSNADLGRIMLQSPLLINTPIGGAAAFETHALSYTSTEAYTAGFVGGGVDMSPTVTFSNSFFVWEGNRVAPNIQSLVAPAFAAFTLLQALPLLRAGSGATFNPLNPLILNAGATVQNEFAGTRTVASHIGMSWSPQLRATLAGAVMNATTMTAVSMRPTFSTVAGSTIGFGTVRGLWAQNPAVALFQPGAGVEGMTAYVAVDVDAIPFGGNVTKVALRSALTPASLTFFLLNNGGAQSNFGGGSLFNLAITQHLGDGIGFSSSYGAAGGDTTVYWDGTQHVTDPLAGDAFRLAFATNLHTLTSASVSPVSALAFNYPKGSFGEGGAPGNNKWRFVAQAETVTVGGDFTQFLMTQAANDTINAALGLYAGWTINAPTPTIGTGSITTQAALNIGGNPAQATTNRVGVRIISNPTGGSGINAALWVTAGLSRFDGRVDINRPIALGGGVAATLGTIGATGPTVAAQAQWVEIDINGVAHWIPAWV